EEGWQTYEWRRQIPEIPICRFALPQWDGQSHPDKVLLLHAEQGLGDSLQFIRFASFARQRVGRLVFLCHPPLLRLFSRVPGIDALVPLGEPPPPCDMHLPLLSLPWVLGAVSSELGCRTPYLSPEPALVEAFAMRLSSIPRPRVGICWQGNPSYRDDKNRSIPVRHFLPLLEAGVELVSVQKNHGLEQLACADPEGRVLNLGPALDLERGAFVDTAAVLANLDLLITSDTAMPHLAGALGVPVWCLLPHVPDWRWGLKGDRTPWYPTMRLFRQTRPGDWDGVFASVRTALASLRGSAQGAKT
ncbi:MAG: hypothetical protein MUC50_23760, partial [Myxococcota bacterium]|nr:hypothetical protein [Myxococcota bacterium]